jgi:hypothetical protein
LSVPIFSTHWAAALNGVVVVLDNIVFYTSLKNISGFRQVYISINSIHIEENA